MRRLFTVVAAGLMLLGAYGTSQAVSFTFGGDSYAINKVAADGVNYQNNNSGAYLGTVVNTTHGGANESVLLLEAVLAALGKNIDITSYSKAEDNKYVGDFPLYLTYADENMSGTWSTGTPPASLVSYYTVKGSNEFALYEVVPASGSGGWNCEHLNTKKGNTPEISHFTGVGAAVGAPVPEPGTLLLLSSGLLGLGLLRRRRNS